jgi:hypothetical protein
VEKRLKEEERAKKRRAEQDAREKAEMDEKLGVQGKMSEKEIKKAAKSSK